jgi:hypothetical protein
MQRPWIFPDMTLEALPAHADRIKAAYETHGLAVFPGMLIDYPPLDGFLGALRYLFDRVMRRYGQSVAKDEDLGEVLVRLKAIAPLAGRLVADMGTQHNKLVEANRLKYADFVTQLLAMAFGPDAVLATPQAGDTLHLFMPGEDFHRYNLPIHQDYPYLMQSPRQATLYLGLSRPHADAGCLEFWPGSQRLGVLGCGFNANGHFEVLEGERVLRDFPCERYYWEIGDVGLFDSLMCHRSVPSSGPSHGRVVQIFRYSDLRDETAESFDWQSAIYQRRGIYFEDIHSDLFVPTGIKKAAGRP